MNRPLRLGVDAANLLVDRRGIGRYARALLRRFADARGRVELHLVVPHLLPALATGKLANEVRSRNFKVARRAAAGRLGLDLIWYPWNGMTWIAPGLKVATMHDVWPFVSPAPDRRIRQNEQVPFRTTAANAQRIIADSKFSKSEITTYLDVDPEKIDVVELGVDPPLPVDADDKSLPQDIGRYVLFVGEAEPRKDLPTLIAAMERLPTDLQKDVKLVVAGRRAHWRNFPKTRVVQTLLVGEITEKKLAALYRGAAVFVFPSRYEGFGLPVLEAMSYGAPVIASDAASIPEAGGDAAIYFPAGDDEALAAQVERVLSDAALAARLREAGKTRAARMTWDRCADLTLAAFERSVD